MGGGTRPEPVSRLVHSHTTIARDEGGRGQGIESTCKHSNREPPHWDDMNYIHTRTTRDPKNANIFILGPNIAV